MPLKECALSFVPRVVLCPRPCFRRQETGDIQPAVDARGAKAAGRTARTISLRGRRDGAVEEDCRCAWQQDPDSGWPLPGFVYVHVSTIHVAIIVLFQHRYNREPRNTS